MLRREPGLSPGDPLAVAGERSRDGKFAGRSRTRSAVLPGLDRGVDKHDPDQPAAFESSAKHRPVRVGLAAAIRRRAGLDQHNFDRLRRLAHFVPAERVAPSHGQFLACRRGSFLAAACLRLALRLLALPPGFFRATPAADAVARSGRRLNRRRRKSGSLTRGRRRVGSALGLAKLRVEAVRSAAAQVQASAHRDARGFACRRRPERTFPAAAAAADPGTSRAVPVEVIRDRRQCLSGG